MLLMTSSTAMGYVISHKFCIRVRFLEQYIQFINYIETEINYSQRNLKEIIEKYKNDLELKTFLKIIIDNLKSDFNFFRAWKNAVHKIPSSYGLLKQDKEFICEFGKRLGTTNAKGQTELCELNKSLVTSILEVAKEEKLKKSKLYFMLCSFLGLSVAIILL